mmetsp:Transcript_24645/g.71254  ORF Transcript_24645/g.71254 Transcript_24645/m.71254 type:complete len:252 (+) Transcript_24645:1348-2103(+)
MPCRGPLTPGAQCADLRPASSAPLSLACPPRGLLLARVAASLRCRHRGVRVRARGLVGGDVAIALVGGDIRPLLGCAPRRRRGRRGTRLVRCRGGVALVEGGLLGDLGISGQLVDAVREAACRTMLAPSTRCKPAHLRLVESVGGTELTLVVGVGAAGAVACPGRQERLAHTGLEQVRLRSHLCRTVGEGTVGPFPAAVLQEELAHLRLHQLLDMLLAKIRLRLLAAHGCLLRSKGPDGRLPTPAVAPRRR